MNAYEFDANDENMIDDGAVQGPLTETGAYAFEAMCEWSMETGLPLRFRRDLWVHDRRAVMDLGKGAMFSWAVHENGTHILYSTHSSTPHTYDDSMGGCLWHWFDGRSLLRASLDNVYLKLRNVWEHRTYLGANAQMQARKAEGTW